MQRKLLLGVIALFLMSLSGLLLVSSNKPAFAQTIYNTIVLETPTATPDANAILNQAATAVAQADRTSSEADRTINIVNTVFGAIQVIGIILGAILAVISVRYFLNDREMKQHLRDIEQQKAEQKADIEQQKKEIIATRTALLKLGLADRLMNQKNSGEAIKIYKDVGNLLPKDPQINYILGRIYSGAGQYNDAIISFDTALASNPTNLAEVQREQGLAYRRRWQEMKNATDLDKAIDYLKLATASSTNDDDAFAILGGLYRRKGEYQQALEYYKRALSINPFSSYALGNVASLSWYMGKPDDARTYFTLTEAAAAARIKQGQQEGFWDIYDHALAELVLGKIVEAKESYRKAIKLTPGKVQFEGVLDNLYLLQKAPQPLAGLNDVVTMVEQARDNAH